MRRLTFKDKVSSSRRSEWSLVALAVSAQQVLRSAMGNLPVQHPYQVKGVAGMPALASGGGLLLISFGLAVVLPTVVFAIYLCFIASSEYVTEARFTVRSEHDRDTVTESLSALSKLTGASSGQTSTQDAFIVTNYITSRAMVQDIGGPAFMERVYGRSDVDLISRLRRNAPIEDLWKYWNEKVQVQVNTVSNLVYLKVRAFDAKSSLEVARNIVTLSEKLVNEISLRARNDAIAEAEAEIGRARDKLSKVRAAMLDYRTRNLMIDPVAEATSIGKVLSQLTLEKVEIETYLATIGDSFTADAPQQRLQRSRLATIERQIVAFQARLTNNNGTTSISGQIGAYEQLKLEEQFAERLYTVAQVAYQRARQDLVKQSLYLTLVVPPTLAQAALYPEPLVSIPMMFVVAAVLWGIVVLLVGSIRENFV